MFDWSSNNNYFFNHYILKVTNIESSKIFGNKHEAACIDLRISESPNHNQSSEIPVRSESFKSFVE